MNLISSTELKLWLFSKTYHNQTGCITNQTDPLRHLCEENEVCKTCVGKNCNSIRSFSKCVHCNREEDPQCAINPQQAIEKVCNAYGDMCFTSITQYNVLRGCIGEQNEDFQVECSIHTEKCAICTPDGKGCNNRAIAMETCVDCDSNEDQKCVHNPKERKGKICSLIDSKESHGCYLKVVST